MGLVTCLKVIMMNSSITTYKRKIIITSIIIMSVVFAVINLSFYYFNNQYLEEKINQENESFVLLISHLLDDSDEYVTLKYVQITGTEMLKYTTNG